MAAPRSPLAHHRIAHIMFKSVCVRVCCLRACVYDDDGGFAVPAPALVSFVCPRARAHSCECVRALCPVILHYLLLLLLLILRNGSGIRILLEYYYYYCKRITFRASFVPFQRVYVIQSSIIIILFDLSHNNISISINNNLYISMYAS